MSQRCFVGKRGAGRGAGRRQAADGTAEPARRKGGRPAAVPGGAGPAIRRPEDAPRPPP